MRPGGGAGQGWQWHSGAATSGTPLLGELCQVGDFGWHWWGVLPMVGSHLRSASNGGGSVVVRGSQLWGIRDGIGGEGATVRGEDLSRGSRQQVLHWP